MARRHYATIGLFVGLALGLNACQRPAADPQPVVASEAPTGSAEAVDQPSDAPAAAVDPQGDTERAGPVVRGEQLLPLEPWTRQFRVIDGDPQGEQLPLSFRRTEQGEPGRWVLELADFNALYLETDADGNVLMMRLDLPEEDRAITYDPPVRLLPAEIRPHTRIEEQSSARVLGLDGGEVQHTGEVSHRVKYASRSRFNTGVGPRNGYLIPIAHEIDLERGNIRLEMAGGYVPGVGLVYRRMSYTWEAMFSLFGETKRRAAVLATEP